MKFGGLHFTGFVLPLITAIFVLIFLLIFNLITILDSKNQDKPIESCKESSENSNKKDAKTSEKITSTVTTTDPITTVDFQMLANTILWTTCCMDHSNNFLFNCVDRVVNDTVNKVPICLNNYDNQHVILTCLENNSCELSIKTSSPPKINVIFHGKVFETELLKLKTYLVLVQNKVSNTGFFYKTTEAMKNTLSESRLPNVWQNNYNYWIGLDRMNYLTSAGLKNFLKIDITNGMVFFEIYDDFVVGDADSNYQLYIYSPTDDFYKKMTLNANYTSFKGSEFQSTLFCNGLSAASWWYSDTCSEAILTTSNGYRGWNGDIRYASMAIGFFDRPATV